MPRTTMDRTIQRLCAVITHEEFDYQALMDALVNYARPRDKVTRLLASKVIIRIKKGIYIFGSAYQKRPYSREILANLIYGPSCVSLEYALHYHGLTPERVETITSVTPERSQQFSTPVGYFTYNRVPMAGFSIGMQRIELQDGRAFLMASAEKALADTLRCGYGLSLNTQKECYEFLTNNLRINETELRQLHSPLLKDIAQTYKSRKIMLLATIVQHLNKRQLKIEKGN